MTNNLDDLRERMLELADEGMRAPVRAPTATPPDSHGAVVLRAAAVIVALAALGAAAWSVAGDQGRGRTLPAVTAPMTSLATPALPDATVPVVDSTASPVDEPAVTEPPAAENTSVLAIDPDRAPGELLSVTPPRSSGATWIATAEDGASAVISLQVDVAPGINVEGAGLVGPPATTPGGRDIVAWDLPGGTSLNWTVGSTLVVANFRSRAPSEVLMFPDVVEVDLERFEPVIRSADWALRRVEPDPGPVTGYVYCTSLGLAFVEVTQPASRDHLEVILASHLFMNAVVAEVDAAFDGRSTDGDGHSTAALLTGDVLLVAYSDGNAPAIELLDLIEPIDPSRLHPTSGQCLGPGDPSTEATTTTSSTPPPRVLNVHGLLDEIPDIGACDGDRPQRSGTVAGFEATNDVAAVRAFLRSATFERELGRPGSVGWWRVRIDDSTAAWAWDGGVGLEPVAEVFIVVHARIVEGGIWSVTGWESSGC